MPETGNVFGKWTRARELDRNGSKTVEMATFSTLPVVKRAVLFLPLARHFRAVALIFGRWKRLNGKCLFIHWRNHFGAWLHCAQCFDMGQAPGFFAVNAN